MDAATAVAPAPKRAKRSEDALGEEPSSDGGARSAASYEAEGLAIVAPPPLFRRNYTGVGFSASEAGRATAAWEDQFVRQHLNGVCVIGVAHGHPILQEAKTVVGVEFVLKDGGKTPKGKGKKNAHYLVAETKLCEVRCQDGSVYTFRTLVRGILYEVNDRLRSQPALLSQQPRTGGYLAMVFPNHGHTVTSGGGLVDEASYNRIVAGRAAARHGGTLFSGTSGAGGTERSERDGSGSTETTGTTGTTEAAMVAVADGAAAVEGGTGGTASPSDPHPASAPASAPCMLFVGVTTGGSAINKVFPAWVAHLGLPAGTHLRGVDLPVGVGFTRMREVLQAALADTSVRGALITTHKITAFRAGRTLFETLDGPAHTLGEVSCVTRNAAQALAGEAADAVVAGRALSLVAPPAYFGSLRPRAHALILGAGGAGLALAHTLLQRPAGRRPAAVVLTDVDERRLADAKQALSAAVAAAPAVDVFFVLVAPGPAGTEETASVLASLPDGSLVVNATGLGKDLPGSPLPETARFPHGCVVWELNYRGERPFLQHAQRQQAEEAKACGCGAGAGLTVTDGWEYFLAGWAYVMSRVFAFDLDDALFQRLRAVANGL